MNNSRLILALTLAGFCPLAQAQTVPAVFPATMPAAAAMHPPYTPVRWNENYSYLARSPDADFFDPIKYIPLGGEDVYLSFGGQARFRYENFSNENFGAVENDEGYYLQRYLLHADLHLGPHVRVFGQIKSSLVDDGREVPTSARPIDKDDIDIQQLFGDLKLPLGEKNSLTLRFGRQDLIYGAQRLISPLDWTNTRRTFEGFKASLALGDHTLDGFVVRPVVIDDHSLNEGNYDVTFAGVYDTIAMPAVLKGANTKLDLYGLGLWDRTTVDIDTYTLGARFATNPKPFDVDVELDYQFGENGTVDISAYSFAVEGGYTAEALTFKPRAYLGFDYASGDEEPADDEFNRFNQLFPLGHAYFGYIDVIARQNIVDLHPGLELTLANNGRYAKKLSLRTDYHLFWRAEENDGVFNAGGGLLRAAGGNDEREIGSELDLLLTWQVDRHLSAYFGYSHFFAGDFIEQTGPGDDIDFAYAAVQYTF